MWLFWVALVAVVLFYLGSSKKQRRKRGGVVHKKARPVFTVADLAGVAPITTQAAASKALRELLVSVGYGQVHKSVLTETMGDFREAMREHLEALQSDVDEFTHALADEREHLEFLCDTEDADETPAERAESAQQRAQVQALQARLAQDTAQLKQYKADRAGFVVAYANHVLHDMPNPSRAWQQAVL
ncbi:hypothetical protein J8G26_08900 [Acidovorax sp. JG5]|uniref:hypothetical protein n=1 Tax=Acidovorax sp. JG5 TaxID=2822718 RepID=UPI001B32EA74|nr:hypothetical protein [Acidovorax sp. JG5]MBP3980844.1 hypothetical protein [Acidovorax sp. JG5]